MYPDGLGLLWVLIGVNIVWTAGLTFLVWQNKDFLRKLFPTEGKAFREKLNEVLEEVKSLEEFKRESLKHIQKMALKRYNPYRDTGGDQSFSLSLLDGQGTGLVVTSLHSRSGTRVFAKPVKQGKEDGFKFSDEEEEVVAQAAAEKNK